ncbi:MAG: 2-alkenal reductase [Alphaproteobacteria bacterium]|jgi:serine protease DegQ|nr:2-alkenal reductase [Alphaproteobacteria bacterium]MDF3034131.1 2-alkenal reductase [Alphaproteobacteria bacterium]
MKKITKYSLLTKAACASLIIAGLIPAVSYATSPGNMEAINSASPDRRNIIGVEMSTATDEQRAAAGCAEKGVFISAVIPKHPAHTAGLEPGDIITKINEFPVGELSDALEAMDGLKGGVKYPFEICRKSQKLTIPVLIEKVQERAIGKIS